MVVQRVRDVEVQDGQYAVVEARLQLGLDRYRIERYMADGVKEGGEGIGLVRPAEDHLAAV